MIGMPIKDNLIVARYYAPRGRKRLYIIGGQLSQRYLDPSDLLIGVIGAEGSGKSTLIKALFPGLELTNDDDGVNIRPTPLFDFREDDFFSGHTFHIDVRYELAFHQPFEITDAINSVIAEKRRVVVEHFDLIYKHLGYNAQIIFAIGEEVRVYRPSVFGPSPLSIKKEADASIKFRLMAHSAEDIIGYILQRDYNFKPDQLHSDVRHGFIIGFPDDPHIDLKELEKKVLEVIDSNVPISPSSGNYIKLGEERIFCTGKRIHVKSSAEIENFRLLDEFRYDPISKQYLLVGIAGYEEIEGFEELPPLRGE